jgi:hypothetical protein
MGCEFLTPSRITSLRSSNLFVSQALAAPSLEVGLQAIDDFSKKFKVIDSEVEFVLTRKKRHRPSMHEIYGSLSALELVILNRFTEDQFNALRIPDPGGLLLVQARGESPFKNLDDLNARLAAILGSNIENGYAKRRITGIRKRISAFLRWRNDPVRHHSAYRALQKLAIVPAENFLSRAV